MEYWQRSGWDTLVSGCDTLSGQDTLLSGWVQGWGQSNNYVEYYQVNCQVDDDEQCLVNDGEQYQGLVQGDNYVEQNQV